MAQQTINVGTAPNDGTGTPLRTAFQYTNSNFSELYTALGGGSGLPGASTQVLFNNGTNIAGDAGLVYNSTTDALTIGGNVQAASATISGDLTVDTSTLKVDSANNRVGIGTASPGSALDIASGTLRVKNAAGDTSGLLIAQDAGDVSKIFNYYNGSIQFGINNTTAMTLNSTGLGVGTTPSYKVHVFGASPALTIQDSTSAAAGVGGTINFIAYTSGTSGANIEAQIKGVKSSASTAGELLFFTSDSSGNSQQRFMVDGTGNLGIGVTPAGTGGCLQLKSGITFPATQVASSDANTLDDYVEGTFTPVIQGVSTAGTGTYTVQSGRYTKIGNRVFVDIFLNWTAHTGTGAMLIANLPFTIKNASNYYPSVTFGQINNIALAANSVLTGYGTFNTKTLNLDQYPVGGGATSSVQIDTSGSIVCSVCYEV